MNQKQKAAKSVNVALGLIVIIAVIIFSPLFGYARGFASKEQRNASAAAVQATSAPLPVAATPRPTPLPTPTPVVLPSAPPAAEPTPVVTPRPVAVPQLVQQPVQQAAPVEQPAQEPTQEPAQEPAQEPVQQPAQEPVQQAAQPAQQYWPQEEYWGGEYYEEDAGAADAGNDAGSDYGSSGLGEQADNGVISTGAADIVINGGGYQEQPAVEYAQPVTQDSSEGEAFTIG